MALTRITKGVIKPNENYDTHNINSTGIVTAVGADFSGNVSVGGVLTYEDVTNVDSVGVITARQGIVSSGVITATDFKKADGSSVGGTQVTIGVRSGAAVTFDATGSSFNVVNRAGGNVAFNL